MKSIFVVVIAILIVIYEIKSDDDKADELCPKCGQSINETRFHAYDDIFKLRWQTPRPGTEKYQESYQDYHSLVSYGLFFPYNMPIILLKCFILPTVKSCIL